MSASEQGEVHSDSFATRAQKIHEKFSQVSENAAKSIDDLNMEAAGELYLLREANIFAKDINSVVFHLAQVAFKIEKGHQTRQELQKDILTLCGISASIHRSLQHDHANIKEELKITVKAVASVAERLLILITNSKDTDVQDHKQALLDNESDLLAAVDKIRLTNSIKTLNLQQLEDVIHVNLDKFKNVLLNFKTKGPNVTDLIVKATSHSISKFKNSVEHLNTAVTKGHFKQDTKNLFLHIVKVFNEYINDTLQIVLRNDNLDVLIEDVHRIISESSSDMRKLLPLLATEDHKSESDQGNELVVYAYVNGVESIIQLRRALEDLEALDDVSIEKHQPMTRTMKIRH